MLVDKQLVAVVERRLVVAAGTKLVVAAGTQLVVAAGTQLVVAAGTQLGAAAGTQLGAAVTAADTVIVDTVAWVLAAVDIVAAEGSFIKITDTATEAAADCTF